MMQKKGLSSLFQPVELTQGECWKTILAFSFPIIVSYLLQQVYTISDAAIVGQTLTAQEVAGVNDTSSLIFIFLQFAFGVSAGIVFGALCDLVLPAPFACLYTIAFTLAALLISTVVSNLLQQGFARALLSTVLTFLLVDLLQAFALLPRSGSTAILPMLHLFARETALSCLLLLPVYPALRAIRRIFPD